MIIFGSGMAGLLAGNMLRRFDPIVFEAQSSLPNNHAALLRFRTDAASKVTNIPFKKVNVSKAISFENQIYRNSDVKLSNSYSQKVTGSVLDRSINSLDPVSRYIAPENFINQMAKGCDIRFNEKLTKEVLDSRIGDKDDPIISTIPMPLLMDMVGWDKKPDFKWSKIWSVTCKIQSPAVEVYQTIYYPGKEGYYRVSITGNIFIMEYITHPGENNMAELMMCAKSVLAYEFGIAGAVLENFHVKEQEYGKLLPIDDDERKEFIMYMTDTYNVYSLGRFATWRQLLLDDIVDDVKQIEALVSYRDGYGKRLTSVGEKK